jgi:hypothetical protein
MRIIDAIRLLSKEGIIVHTTTTFVNEESGGTRRDEFLFEDDRNYVVRSGDGVELLSKRVWKRQS